MSELSGKRFLISGAVLGQPMGGVRRHNQELLPRLSKLLQEEGAELALLEGQTPAALELPESIERLPSKIPAGPPLQRALREGPEIERLLESARAKSRPFALVHFGHLPVPRRLSVPFTLTLHDLRDLSFEHTPFSRRFFAKHIIGDAARRAAKTLAPSEHVRSEIARVAGVDIERTALVPNAANHFVPLERKPAADAPLLHLGHLEPRKNLEVLLRALHFDSSLPRLVLAGAAKPGEEERLRALCEELKLANRVEFRGPFEDSELPELLSQAACLVLPSRLEGFGIPVLEAQRAGCPLAIAEIPALREVAGAKTPSFNPDDAEACAAAVRHALDQPALEPPPSRTWEDAAKLWRDAWASTLNGAP